MSSWEAAYAERRTTIRQGLTLAERERCEERLKTILQDLYTKNGCADDRECALLEALPFGAVAVRAAMRPDLRDRMSDFKTHCDDGSTHFAEPADCPDLIQEAVCHEGRCMIAAYAKK